jgi:HNH endonuclease
MSQDSTPTVRYRDISNYPGYRVGDDGSIWSKVRKRSGDQVWYGEWKLMKPRAQNAYGHVLANLGRTKYEYVHRLVLEAFVGPCPPESECRHIDGNPANNHLSNLAWGTRKENYADSVRHGTAQVLRGEHAFGGKKGWDYVEHKTGEKHHRAKLTDEQVQIVYKLVDPHKRDGTASRLAKEWGVSYQTIRLVARRLRRCSG